MELHNDYFFIEAKDIHAKDIQNVVFTVLKEYGLPIDPGQTDSDLSKPKTFYYDGYFGIIIYKKSNQIVGTFGMKPHDKEQMEIRKMYLLKEHRGKGIGKFMLHFLLNKAKEMQYPRAILETASSLFEAVNLYESWGFKPIHDQVYTPRCDKMYYIEL